MKQLKKVLAFVLTAVLMMAMGLTALAANGTITITPPVGIDEEATNTYTIYKVFDASGDGVDKISYKLVAEKTEAPAGFSVDAAGNVSYAGNKDAKELTEADIAAIAAYVKNDKPVATVTSTGTAAAVSEALPNGYYYITTSTGTCVTIDSTNPNANVEDKNIPASAPEKKITGADSMDAAGKNALAQVGTTVEFSVSLVKTKGARNYVLHDTMTEGLEYNGDADVTTPAGAVYDTETADGDSVTVTFDNEWLAGLKDGTEIVVTYSATVTSDALSSDPANNTATLDYGNGYTTDGDTVEIYNGKFTVKKQDEKEKPLSGAGFVVAKNDGSALVYYKLADGAVTWVSSIDDATEYKSDSKGAVTSFTGLADGTYTLIEKTVPAGYNKAEDTEFVINASDYKASNLEQSATVTNNAGVELPSTGGAGTTAFYLVGSILVIGAGIVLVTKRRMCAL